MGRQREDGQSRTGLQSLNPNPHLPEHHKAVKNLTSLEEQLWNVYCTSRRTVVVGVKLAPKVYVYTGLTMSFFNTVIQGLSISGGELGRKDGVMDTV